MGAGSVVDEEGVADPGVGAGAGSVVGEGGVPGSGVGADVGLETIGAGSRAGSGMGEGTMVGGTNEMGGEGSMATPFTSME